MSRRIDIELTSAREDGSWTWRAAGAKQPKGALDGSLLPNGAAVGDVVRAEVETSLDGTDVLSVAAPKGKNRAAVETIELITRELRDDELVVETRVKRGRRDRGDRGERGERRGGDRNRRDGDRRGRRDGERSGGERGARRDRGERGERGERSDRNRNDRPRRDRPAPPAKPKAKRLRPLRTHRKAALEALAPEEQVIAEQVLQGGLPAVRQAVEKMNEQATAEGRPTVKPDALLAVAEKLLPRLRSAEWRDRAEAAVADLDELDLRDLRSVVAAADHGAKDDEARALAAQLRDGLTRRVDDEQAKWLAEIAENLDDGRVVRALRLSSRPPKPAPLPAELATRLTEAAAGSLTADTFADRWATVLDALQFSPIRLNVAPASKPETPSSELLAAITRVAGRVPKVAEAFGIEVPAEAPRRRGRAAGGARKPKGKVGNDGAKRPAPAAEAPATEAPAAEASAGEETTAPPAAEVTAETVEAPAEAAVETAEASTEAAEAPEASAEAAPAVEAAEESAPPTEATEAAPEA